MSSIQWHRDALNYLNGQVNRLITLMIMAVVGVDVTSVPEDAMSRRVPDMRRFVQTQGGAYFFMPGMAVLEQVVEP